MNNFKKPNIGRALKLATVSALCFFMLEIYAFNPELNGDVHHIAIQNDVKILIAGNFSAVRTISRRGVTRLNENGTID